MATPERDWYPHERQPCSPHPFRHGDTWNEGREEGPCLTALAPRLAPAPNTASRMNHPVWRSVTVAPGRRPHPSHRGPSEDKGWARLSRNPPAGGLWAPLTTLPWVSGPLTCRCGIYKASIATRATSLKRILSIHTLLALFLLRVLSSSNQLVDGRAQVPCPGAHLARSIIKLKAWQPQEHGGDTETGASRLR